MTRMFTSYQRSGGFRIFKWMMPNPKLRAKNLLFGQILLKYCMKMKEIVTRARPWRNLASTDRVEHSIVKYQRAMIEFNQITPICL